MIDPFRDERLAGVISAAIPDRWQEMWPDYTRFTAWLPLANPRAEVREGAENRSSIGSHAGVYLVALFEPDEQVPDGPADPFHDRVVYIGRTRSGSLGSRWSNFLSAAQSGDANHSGGNSFYSREIKGKRRDGARVINRTYVAGLPVWFGAGSTSAQPATSFRTALLEAALVEAVHHHRCGKGLSPLLNKP